MHSLKTTKPPFILSSMQASILIANTMRVKSVNEQHPDSRDKRKPDCIRDCIRLLKTLENMSHKEVKAVDKEADLIKFICFLFSVVLFKRLWFQNLMERQKVFQIENWIYVLATFFLLPFERLHKSSIRVKLQSHNDCSRIPWEGTSFSIRLKYAWRYEGNAWRHLLISFFSRTLSLKMMIPQNLRTWRSGKVYTAGS